MVEVIKRRNIWMVCKKETIERSITMYARQYRKNGRSKRLQKKFQASRITPAQVAYMKQMFRRLALNETLVRTMEEGSHNRHNAIINEYTLKKWHKKHILIPIDTQA